ncbi:MAG: type II toxin-antitoxin system VapC family toxin [Nitrososphaerales archaeon]
MCLDTSFIVDIIRGNAGALQELKRLENKGSSITTAAITTCELFEGAYGSEQPEKEVSRVKAIVHRIELLEFTLDVCERYGKLKSAGRTIGDLDTLIASAALVYNEPLLTSNIEHFNRVPNLIVKDW